jgi:hypothetical protein
MREIPEEDWKNMRRLKTRALNQACSRILDAVPQILQNRDEREHEAYLELWKMLQEQDDLIATMFNDFKKSTAYYKLAAWRHHGLLSEEDMALFTEETQAAIELVSGNMR